MWNDYIMQLSQPCNFNAPAIQHEIFRVERVLQVVLLKELAELLQETNGVTDRYGFGVIWSTVEIERRNQEMRSHSDFAELYMPFEHLLFFADNGNGDLFAFPILAGTIRNLDVFLWDHETDSRVWYATSLRDYLEKRIRE